MIVASAVRFVLGPAPSCLIVVFQISNQIEHSLHEMAYILISNKVALYRFSTLIMLLISFSSSLYTR